MGKFDGILLATDLDGTLLMNDKTVSEENADAIRRFQNEGGLFTVATGRYPDFLLNYSESFKVNECVIALNGNMIYNLSNEKMLYVSRMNRTSIKDILDLALDTFKNEIRLIDINDETESYIYEGTIRRDVCKCVIVADSAASAVKIRDALRKAYGDSYKVVRSWDTGVEIYDLKSGKGECIEYIRKNINPSIRKTVCVGDFENDISMLELADIGYAVKNSAPDALKAADKITEADNEHHAIAWVINDLEKEGI